jgi:bifunctional non-homologous end joining protein LigD
VLSTFPGFVPPCLPIKAKQPPSGAAWLHEIKHDGFRVIAWKDGKRVKLYSRPGNDLTYRFPLIVEALGSLHSRSCIIDGEAVACGEDGVPSFDRIRYRKYDASVFLYAFDLIAFNGDDLRREPLEVRKATLASVLAKASPACSSTSTWRTLTAMSCSAMPARLAWRGSCRSGSVRAIVRGGREIGSSSRTRQRLQ